MKATTVRFPEAVLDALDEMSREAHVSEGIEDLSRSDLIRRFVSEGIEDSDLADLLDEESRILLERRDSQGSEWKVRNLRSGFETRVKKSFTERFQNGYKPDQVETYAENMREEARILWPEWSSEDYSDRRREALRYVDRVCEEAVAAIEDSDRDPLDPAELFDRFEGVEAARDPDPETVQEDRVAIFAERAETLLSEGVPGDRVASRLEAGGANPGEARQAVAAARGGSRDGQEENRGGTTSVTMTSDDD